METIDYIPISKIRRAGKLVETGAKVGVNYLKYYGNRILNSEEEALEQLNKDNADDIYDSLKLLKGSALKVAQMMSMEKSLLPEAYVEKFSLSQFSVPPLSPPLVNKTFKFYFGKLPHEVFDQFESNSCNAASIGQVHKATKDGKELAVKIQYPGVSESIKTDLKLVRPVALKILNISAKDADVYFKEVEDKLIEETNYSLELAQSLEITEACNKIPNLIFPKYYPAYSSERIITMDWMQGKHISEVNLSKKNANKLGQALWDFYMFQIHQLKKVHADPHPGNFLVNTDNELIAIDFGCMKIIPEEFYNPYFKMINKETLNTPNLFENKLYELDILKPSDSAEEKKFFTKMFHEILSIFAKPFQADVFDFSDDDFFEEISKLGEQYAKNNELRKMDANRGSKHFIYVNRTFFGLFSLMNSLKASEIKINNYTSFK